MTEVYTHEPTQQELARRAYIEPEADTPEAEAAAEAEPASPERFARIKAIAARLGERALSALERAKAADEQHKLSEGLMPKKSFSGEVVGESVNTAAVVAAEKLARRSKAKGNLTAATNIRRAGDVTGYFGNRAAQFAMYQRRNNRKR